MESKISHEPGLRIDQIQLRAASPEDQRSGLWGWVTFVLASALRVDGVTLRRTRQGLRTLSIPARTDRNGQQHDLLRPLHERARREIERQLFDALGMM